MNAAQKIKAAQRANEKLVLARVRQYNSGGSGYAPFRSLGTRAWNNAIDRLEERGAIRWRRGPYNARGYWLAPKKKGGAA